MPRSSAARQGLSIDQDGALLLARASRDAPREALGLLASIRDEAQLRDRAEIDSAIVSAVPASLGIDADGLGPVDRALLEALREAGRPLSLGTLADRIGKTPGALLRVHEPFLIRRGLIARTIHGTRAHPAARPLSTIRRRWAPSRPADGWSWGSWRQASA